MAIVKHTYIQITATIIPCINSQIASETHTIMPTKLQLASPQWCSLLVQRGVPSAAAWGGPAHSAGTGHWGRSDESCATLWVTMGGSRCGAWVRVSKTTRCSLPGPNYHQRILYCSTQTLQSLQCSHLSVKNSYDHPMHGWFQYSALLTSNCMTQHHSRHTTVRHLLTRIKQVCWDEKGLHHHLQGFVDTGMDGLLCQNVHCWCGLGSSLDGILWRRLKGGEGADTWITCTHSLAS